MELKERINQALEALDDDKVDWFHKCDVIEMRNIGKVHLASLELHEKEELAQEAEAWIVDAQKMIDWIVNNEVPANYPGRRAA